ncbi:ring finger domain-containing protein [Phthorimaea operculella]|nr:ring finger domain-containing protein [Phthorimaea operculella]
MSPTGIKCPQFPNRELITYLKFFSMAADMAATQRTLQAEPPDCPQNTQNCTYIMSGKNEVIDLTDSFTLIDHCQLADVIIELDDSNYVPTPEPASPRPEHSSIPKKPTKKKTPKKCLQRSPSRSPRNNRSKSAKGIGDCPVCWDELGKNSLASTKCGNIFCLRCIQQVVKQTKSCPTCRCPLKGAAAYHPIYLSLQ